MSYKNKTIVLGVTGGIAIYKVPDLIRRLKKRGLNVEVVMTESAREFITPLTFKEVSGNPVHFEMFSPPSQWRVAHISLARKADLLAIIPATANIIGKIACGIADDLLSTTVMATEAPVLLGPAMNSVMYNNQVVQKNLSTLRELGYRVLPSESGEMLCGEVGAGRLPGLEVIEEEILKLLTPQDLAGKRILITAGPTREYIDPVRFISNASSGRMGYALARDAYRRGAEVTLISGPTELANPVGVKRLSIQSTMDLYERVMAEYEKHDICIMSAAPADFRPENVFPEKVKKSGTTGEKLRELSLLPNPDIAKKLGEVKGGRFLAIFAAETQDLLDNARSKLIAKNADLVIANNLRDEGAGFGALTNKVTILTAEERKDLPLLSKEEVAKEINSAILRRLNHQSLMYQSLLEDEYDPQK
jgi:phosphopantothenoylcysteine decarboxylase/phosphopantothenate--cysteine ligase